MDIKSGDTYYNSSQHDIANVDWNYKVDLERELNAESISIASCELCSVLDLIEHSRNDEVQFYRLVNYAKQLQKALFHIEWGLKDREVLKAIIDRGE